MRIFTEDGREVPQADQRDALARRADELLSQGRLGLSRHVNKKLAKRKARLAYLERVAAAPLPPKRAPALPGDQGVYVIGATGYPMKIGIAADVRKRLATIQTGCPEKLRVYLFLDVPSGSARLIEQECHQRLAAHRKNGEWFAVDWRDAVQMVRTVAQRHQHIA